MLALQLPGSLKVLNPYPVDWSYGPYANVAAAKTAIPLAIRYDGLTVQITGSGNYWWKQTDLTDTGLIPKDSNINVSSGILLGRTTAASGLVEEITVSNGLTLSAPGTTTLKLGGALTVDTDITGAFRLRLQNANSTTGALSIQSNYTPAAGSGVIGIAPTLTMSQAGAPTSHVLFANTQSWGVNNATHRVFDFGNTVSNPGGFTGTKFIGYYYNPNVTAATHYAMIINQGIIGISTTTPTAGLHIALNNGPGAGTAALKIATGGTLMTVPENGAFETDTSHLYFTIGGTRFQLDQQVGGGTTLDSVTGAANNATRDHTNKAIEWQWSTLAGANGLKLSSVSTVAASNAQILLNITLSGANGTASQTTYGAKISNTHTGSTSTNFGLYTAASGATTNWAAGIIGDLKLGDATLAGDRIIDVSNTAGNAKLNIKTQGDITLDGSGSGSNLNLSIGQINLGSTSHAGTGRTILAQSSGGNTSLNLLSSGTGDIVLSPSVTSVNGVSISVQGASGNARLCSYTNGVLEVLGYDKASGGQGLILRGGNSLSGNGNGSDVSIRSGAPDGAGTEAAVNIQTRVSAKLGFWNVTAIVRPTTAGGAATFVANSSAITNDTATFDGYTLGQIVRALRLYGLLT